jgi:hypothetical protein
MRRQALVVILLPLYAMAAPLEISAVFELSKTLRTEASNEKSPQKKLSKLRQLEKKLATVKKEYQKKNPEQGDTEERKVLIFDATFDPLFEIKSFGKADCEKIQDRIESENAMGKEENAPLTNEAKEAVEWIKVLCADSKSSQI